jgi:hypothetical protein
MRVKEYELEVVSFQMRSGVETVDESDSAVRER